MASSRLVRVRVLQVAYDDAEDPDARLERVSTLVRAQRGADLVVLPELWAHGAFSPEGWARDAVSLDGDLVPLLGELAAELDCVLHAGSVIERAAEGEPPGPSARGLWNTSLVFGRDGRLTTAYRKIHRFGFGEGEPQLLEAGETPTTTELSQGTAGLATCYDLRFPELFRTLVDLGAEIFVVPAAWPAARREHWELLGRARALENQAYVVQANTAGRHGGVDMGGHSQVVDPTGQVVVQAGDGEEVLSVDIDLRRVEEFRHAFPVLPDRRL